MRNQISMLSRIASIAFALAVLGGCSPGNDLRQWVSQEKARKGQPLDPLPVIKTFETFEYKDQELRDPFNVSAEEQDQSANNGPHPDQDRAREPLESFPLDGLKMAGTLGMKAMEGLIRDPDGVVHRVHVGNYLGQNFGKITGISEDHIELVELVPNGSGGWMERQATIALGDTKK